MSKGWEGGSTRDWRKVRAQVLQRDRRECQLKIDGVCTHRATHVHHVAGRAATGDNPAYLVAACQPCNLHIGDPTRHDPEPKPWAGW